MLRLLMCAAIPLLITVSPVSAQDNDAFREVLVEGFDDMPVGRFVGGANGWNLLENTDTSAWIVDLGEGNHALRILDDHSALSDATCWIRHGLPSRTGRHRISLRLMFKKGEAGAIAQDSGLHLFDGGVLLDLFFSGSELKTWQGKGWAGFDPPVSWQDGQWHDVELLLDPPAGTVAVRIDEQSRGTVALRRPARGLSMVELVSQRTARGELWVDNLRIEHEVPAELRARPSAEWLNATREERMAAWYADEGTQLRAGALAPSTGKLASMRRLLPVDMKDWPVLFFDVEGAGDVEYTLYACPVDGSEPEALVLQCREFSPLELDLFALTAWQGKMDVELLCSARGEGRLTLSDTRTDTSPPNEYLKEPASVARFLQQADAPSRLASPVTLTAQGSPGERQPITMGIPFPEGALGSHGNLRLRDPRGRYLLHQAQPLALWRDGTVRWLLIDTIADIPPSGSAELILDSPAEGEPVPGFRPMPVLFRVSDGTGAFTPIGGAPLPLNGQWDMVARFSDRTFKASLAPRKVRVETNGFLRKTVVVEGMLSDGAEAPFTYEVRFTLHAGLRRVEIAPSFLLVTDEPEVQLQEMTFVLPGALTPGAVVFGGDGPVSIQRPAGQTASLRQDSMDHYAVSVGDTEAASGKRAAGWVSTSGMTLAVRRFWQQFAKGIEVSDDAVRIELWSPMAAPRRFGRGAAKTHNILLSFEGSDPAQLAAQFEYPPVLYPGAQWYFDSVGLGNFPIPSEKHAQIDAIFEYAVGRRITEQQRRASTSYDMVHYGDINHINSEIDAHKAFFMQWARTGDRKWLDFALDWSLHSQDIDVCHYSPNPREIGIHHSHYPSDHNNGGLTLTHTWIEGQLFRYYLTGDRRTLLAADLAGRAFSRSMLPSGQMFDGGRKGGGIGSRAYGRACWALGELYRATHNPRYLSAMRKLLSYLTAGLREDGAVPASHNGAGVWNASDECPHMAAICAVGIARYSEMTGDMQFLPALERIAKWQMSRGAMPEKLGIMYHNYPGGETIHFIDACGDMLEAWAYLYDVTGDRLYRDFAASVYDTLVEMRTRWRHDWTMGVANVLIYAGRADTFAPVEDPPAAPPEKEAVVNWLRSCQNPDGGFGVSTNLPSDMDSTARAVEALAILGSEPADADACAAWLESCHNDGGGYAGEPGWHSNTAWTALAIGALQTLGRDLVDPDRTASWLNGIINQDGGNGSSPVTGRMAYHPGWTSAADYTGYKAVALKALGAEISDAGKMSAYLRRLQTDEGGFKHGGGSASSGYTLNALDGLAALGASPDRPEECVEWLLACRRNDGGFGWPSSEHSTVRNTAQCVLALGHLGKLPAGPEADATRSYLVRCRHASGGYAHTPGRVPTIAATWYAIKALRALGGAQ